MTITWDRAVCIYYMSKYTKKDAQCLTREFEKEHPNEDLCYTEHELIPVVVVKKRIYGCPSVFKSYPKSNVAVVVEEYV